MRMSTAQVYYQNVTNMMQKQTRLNELSEQLSTGKRFLKPSDDPVAAVRALDISENLARLEQYGRNANTANTQLALEDSVLDGVGTVLKRVRELVVQANNASQGSESRAAIASEVEARVGELLNLANTRDASDEFIFAGFQSHTQPFVASGGAVSYVGDDGQRFLQLAENADVAVRDSGREVFMSAGSGNGVYTISAAAGNTGTAVVGVRSVDGAFVADNYSVSFTQAAATDPISYNVTDGSGAVIATGTYTAGESLNVGGASFVVDGNPANGDSFNLSPSTRRNVFDSLQGIVEALRRPSDSPAEQAALNNAMATSLDELDQSLDHVLQVRADVGTRMNHVDNQDSLREHFDVALQENLSEVQDLDYAEAISKFNLQLTALQAAQQTFVKTQGLSLFNYL